jgi:hypothetical protein
MTTRIPALERAAARWRTAALVTADDLLTDVRNVRRSAAVLGPAAAARSMRDIAERALAHPDAQVRAVASQLVSELAREGAGPTRCP